MSDYDRVAADQGAEAYDGPTVDHSTPGEAPPFAADLLAILHEAPPYETVHLCPPDGSGVMPCCGRAPFEALEDRMTIYPRLVTCSDLPTDAACDRGPCHLPRGHEGRCNPGGDAITSEGGADRG